MIKSIDRLNILQTLYYSVQPTPFGKVILSYSDLGITELRFIDGSVDSIFAKIRKRWKNSTFVEENKTSAELIREIFDANSKNAQFNLHLAGTEFQLKVWNALLSIKKGDLSTYKKIAEIIGHEKSSRAVGNAISQNPIHYIIPCHRVVRTDGGLGGFAGGVDVKRAILSEEMPKSMALAEN